MGWVKEALASLNTNGTCQIRPHGGSMRGRIESGQLVTLKRVTPEELQIDDAIFVKWKGNYLLHLIHEITSDQVVIANNLGKINGTIPISDVLAKVVSVEN